MFCTYVLKGQPRRGHLWCSVALLCLLFCQFSFIQNISEFNFKNFSKTVLLTQNHKTFSSHLLNLNSPARCPCVDIFSFPRLCENTETIFRSQRFSIISEYLASFKIKSACLATRPVFLAGNSQSWLVLHGREYCHWSGREPSAPTQLTRDPDLCRLDGAQYDWLPFNLAFAPLFFPIIWKCCPVFMSLSEVGNWKID